MRDVAIYRHQLFKRSEPFISQQAAHIPGVRAVLVGRERWGACPEGMSSVAMTDQLRYRSICARAIHAVTASPSPFLEILRPYDISLVHAHFGIDGVYAQRLARKLDVPLVTTFHGFDATVSRTALLALKSPAALNYLLRRRHLALGGHLFICVSNFIREKVIALGFPSNRCVVHHMGIDTESIVEAPHAERSAAPTVIHVARLVEKKGTAILLDAFKRVKERLPDARLEIIGEGPLKDALCQRASALGLAESVAFLGGQPYEAVMQKLRSSWLLALPSITARNGDAEGLGQVLLEAAATGLPVVASRSGGIPDAVIDGSTGLLHDEANVDQLAENIAYLLENGSARARMGRAARLHVERNFNLSRQSSLLNQIYEGVL